MAFGGGGLAVIIIAAIVVTSFVSGPSTAPGSFSIAPSQVALVTGVPVKSMVSSAEACMKSSACFDQTTGAIPPYKLPAKNPTLMANGRPEIVYVGANFCPFCAGERWSMVMALSKFGTFSHLSGTTSSSTDVNASTPTFTFYGSKYSSKYLAFLTDEQETNTQQPLQAPTALEQRLINKWDVSPYTTQSGSIPFAYLGGRFLVTGIQYDASSIAGTAWLTAAENITSGTTPVSKHAEAAAGFLVGDICAMTNGKPASVCSQVPPNLKGVSTSSHVIIGSSTKSGKSNGSGAVKTSKSTTGAAKKTAKKKG